MIINLLSMINSGAHRMDRIDYNTFDIVVIQTRSLINELLIEFRGYLSPKQKVKS